MANQAQLSAEAEEAIQEMEEEATGAWGMKFISVGNPQTRWMHRAAHLRAAGVAASSRVAEVILKFLRQRSEYTYYAVLVAGELLPTPDLLSAIQKVIDAPASIHVEILKYDLQNSRTCIKARIHGKIEECYPEICGEGVLAWNKPTHQRITQQATTVLQKLSSPAINETVSPQAKEAIQQDASAVFRSNVIRGFIFVLFVLLVLTVFIAYLLC